MLQLKLCFPHFQRCIRGVTDQYRLPMSSECLLMFRSPAPAPAGAARNQKGLAEARPLFIAIVRRPKKTRYFSPLIRSRSLPEHLNVTTRLGESIMASPVAGFRPFRWDFSRT